MKTDERNVIKGWPTRRVIKSQAEDGPAATAVPNIACGPRFATTPLCWKCPVGKYGISAHTHTHMSSFWVLTIAIQTLPYFQRLSGCSYSSGLPIYMHADKIIMSKCVCIRLQYNYHINSFAKALQPSLLGWPILFFLLLYTMRVHCRETLFWQQRRRFPTEVNAWWAVHSLSYGSAELSYIHTRWCCRRFTVVPESDNNAVHFRHKNNST